MTQAVTRWRSRKGKEYNTQAEAEFQDLLYTAECAIYARYGSGYSPGYDGPMQPLSYSLADALRNRQALRHLFLDVPPAPPEVRVETKTVVLRRWPHQLVGWGVFLAGVLLGGFLF